MDYARRQRSLQNLIDRQNLDALLITYLPNIRYLCGFSGSSGALLVSESGSVLFTDGRYTQQTREEVKKARVVIGGKSALTIAAEWLGRRHNLKTIGIEAERVSISDRARLARIFPSGIRLRAAQPLVERLRMIKDEDEVCSLRSAVVLGASLFDYALRAIRPGVKETQVAAEMEYAARCGGAEGMSFETIVASGMRSALPHGRASQAAVPRRGFVLCDFGVILAGYCSDMTRMVHVGPATGEARAVYEAVREAQQAARETVRPGVSLGEVDRSARTILKRKKLATYFSHSTGHGVGLEIHEAPRVAAGQSEVLQPGMVITIEPGVYFPGKWGVRIEDMLVVTDHGHKVLTPTSRQLLQV